MCNNGLKLTSFVVLEIIDASASAASFLDDRNSDGRYRNCSIVDTLVRWMVVPPSSSSSGGAALPPPGNAGDDEDDDAAAGGGRGCGIKRLGWGRTRGGSGGRGGVDDGLAIGADVNLTMWSQRTTKREHVEALVLGFVS